MKKIAYIANPVSIHDCKWINIFAKKYNVIVISSEYNNKETKLNNNIKVYDILPSIFPLKDVYKRYKILRKLKMILRKEKVDIVHSMYAFPNSFWVYLSGFKNHIITTRGSDILVDYKSMFVAKSLKQRVINYYYKKLFRKTFNNAIYITSTSEKQKKLIETFVNNKDKLRVIRTGIDIEQITKYFDNLEKKNIKFVYDFLSS